MECQQSIATQTAQEVNVEVRSSVTRKIQFRGANEEYEPSTDCSSGDETLSGSHAPSVRQCRNDQGTECFPAGGVDIRARNVMNKSEDDDAEPIGSSDDSQSQLSQPWKNGSETTSNSDVSEIAIQYLLVEWKWTAKFDILKPSSGFRVF